MIKAIVFDLDGMVYYEPGRFSNFYADKFGVPIENLLDFFRNEYVLCQKGELDLKEVLPKHFAKWQWSESIEDLIELWANFGELDQGLVDFTYKLKNKGIKCLLATNNERYRFEKMNEKYKFDQIFDGIINSYKIKSLKPEDKFNEEIVNFAGFPPENIFVCDDKEKFVRELKNYGFLSYLYTNIKQFHNDIQNLGIN